MLQKDLFEELREEVHCTYISDLHSEEYSFNLLMVIEGKRADDFCIEEWVDLVNYLCGCQFLYQGQTKQSLKNFVITFLNHKSRGNIRIK